MKEYIYTPANHAALLTIILINLVKKLMITYFLFRTEMFLNYNYTGTAINFSCSTSNTNNVKDQLCFRTLFDNFVSKFY